MQTNSSRVTVFFEEPFWVCVYEKEEEGALRACKITFGAQPAEGEVYAFLLENWHKLRFGPPLPVGERHGAHRSPKRRQRAAKQELAARGVGTRAQQALQAQRELCKTQSESRRREAQKEDAERRFALRCEKRKQKHRGH